MTATPEAAGRRTLPITAAAFVAAVVACALVLLAGAGPVRHAAASDGVYPPDPPAISTDSSVYPPGGDATVTLEGFEDCPLVEITVDGEVIIVVTSGQTGGTGPGGEAGTVTVPMPTEPGDYEIIATCPATGETVSTTVTVSAVTPTDPPTTAPGTTTPGTGTTAGGNLPSTGSESSRPVQMGLLLLIAGATFLLVSRRRHPDHVTTRRWR